MSNNAIDLGFGQTSHFTGNGSQFDSPCIVTRLSLNIQIFYEDFPNDSRMLDSLLHWVGAYSSRSLSNYHIQYNDDWLVHLTRNL